MISARRLPTSGWTIPLSVLRASSSLKALAARAGRSNAPSADRMSSPNASTSVASPSVPGSTTSRAITSPSTTIPPQSREGGGQLPTFRRRCRRSARCAASDSVCQRLTGSEGTPRLVEPGRSRAASSNGLGAAGELLPQSGQLRVAGERAAGRLLSAGRAVGRRLALGLLAASAAANFSICAVCILCRRSASA